VSVDIRRSLPSIDQLLQDSEVRERTARLGRPLVLAQARALLDELRERLASEPPAAAEALVADLPRALARRADAAASASLVEVINATGVVVHTNLGRAPLSPEAAQHVARVAASYSNLEYDLAAGQRGAREVHAEPRLRRMLGCEAVVVVNNNAAAVMLAVNTLAEGRDVLVSRGELVEIGGSFRIPEVLRKGGARLREVGTTNRTRLSDYEAALSPDTALILKVHPSNFRIVGFTEAPTLAELAALARRAGLPLVEDLGSGLLAPVGPLSGETSVGASLAAGADAVTFSGDKLLGGPQAGFVAGRAAIVSPMRGNPLYRALRVDKLTLAALDATLVEHEAGRAAERVPVLRMLTASRDEIRRRAEALAAALRAELPDLAVSVIDGSSAVGGGAAPTLEIETALLVVEPGSRGPDALATALRGGSPPVIGRVADGRLLLDLRTVAPEQEPALRSALRRALAGLED
jgi:L-seryl-tRNA(Ser) seleniumtransferase